MNIHRPVECKINRVGAVRYNRKKAKSIRAVRNSVGTLAAKHASTTKT